MSTSIDFDVVWGGYYATRSGAGGFSVFRLLDFNQHAYHAALFTEEFASLPSADVVVGLRPLVSHAPIDPSALVREGDRILVGRAPLTRDQLVGYLYFLEAHDVPEPEREDLVRTLIGLSREPPLALRLELTADGLEISERA